MKDQYWLLFAITLVGMLVGSAVPVVLVGPAICGIYLCLFQKIDGKPVVFESLFKGFDYFMASLIVSIVITVPIFLLLITIYIPMIGMAVAGQKMSENEIMPFLIGVFVFEFFTFAFSVFIPNIIRWFAFTGP